MSYAIDKGYTDTVTQSKNVACPDLSWATDYSVKTDTASEVILVNTTSPMDRPETVRFSITDVNDIYAQSSVDPNFRAPSKKGVSLLVQVTDVFRYADASDLSKPAFDLPVSAHLVLKVPKSSLLSADDYQSIVARLFAAVFDTGNVSSTRLSKMLRGALDPRA